MVLNPALFITLLDTLQQISFILYTQVNYPQLVLDFFELFSIYDADFGVELVPKNKYYVKSPEGFFRNDVDSLFIRNAG